tara:strand:- start:118 stop:891 length:774 start_codon:yes stop_codon:yes gene_type:complete
MEKTKIKKYPGVPEGVKWEIQDRLYTLNGKKPLVYTVLSKHSGRRPLLWFDEKAGYNKELRYATNMASPLVEEQKGEATLGRIVFRNGKLFVDKKDQCLQKLLSLYHPLKGKIFSEYNAVEEAVDDLAYLEYELAALNAAKSLDIEEAEAILRSEIGSDVNNLTSKEIKRDVHLMARRNPSLFLQLANDENVELRNFGAKCVENNLIKLSDDQRVFTYPNNKKLCVVPYDEHPYNALAAFFKTDEGMEVYKNLSKKL